MSLAGAASALSRRAGFLLVLVAASCSGGGDHGGPERFEPLTYEYLMPIRLNVAAVDIEPRVQPPVGGIDMTPLDPVRPADAVTQMAHDRLQALGTAGRAVFVISDASIVREGGAYAGSLAVELDIYTSANTRAAFAEARVSGRRSVEDSESRRRALYELTKQLMDQLNVEFEYQVRRSLREWLVAAPTSTPAPVEQQVLPPPPR